MIAKDVKEHELDCRMFRGDVKRRGFSRGLIPGRFESTRLEPRGQGFLKKKGL